MPWLTIKNAIPILGALAAIIFFGLWRLEVAETKNLEAQIDSLQDTVLDREADLQECGQKAQNLEKVANDRQVRINALNQSIASNKLRAEQARCIPVLR